jgi:hypothetical protein
MARGKASASAAREIYGVHPGVIHTQRWLAGLKAKTGRDADEWAGLVRDEGPPGESERVAWLKSAHGQSPMVARWLAARADGRGLEDGDPEAYLRSIPALVDAQYAGKRAGLRPIYEALLALGLGLGDDVRACPCKTMVPLYRNHVFAQLTPATNARLDLGLALADHPAGGRLIDTGGFAKKDRITRRVAITSLDEIDDEVRHWMRAAYDRDA